MNIIECSLKQDSINVNILNTNYKVDNLFWLDEKLQEYYPEINFSNLKPTWLMIMETNQIQELNEAIRISQNRIYDYKYKKRFCPIYYYDVSVANASIIVEIERTRKTFKWNRFGIVKDLNLIQGFDIISILGRTFYIDKDRNVFNVINNVFNSNIKKNLEPKIQWLDKMPQLEFEEKNYRLMKNRFLKFSAYDYFINRRKNK